MRTCLLGIAILALYVPSAAAREWTDKTGTKKVEAELIRVENDVAYLRLPNGDLRSTKLDRLSGEDRETARSWAGGGAGKPGLVANTLAFRKTSATAGRARIPAPKPVNDQAGKSLYRLTGWSGCSPWYCCEVTTCCPQSPCPPQVDYGKRIFKGCKCTFHLVSATGSSVPIPQNGTVAFERYDTNGCCHRYLEYLKFNNNPPGWLFYEAPDPVGGVTYWAIYINGIPGLSNGYEVKRWTANGWVHYDWACREIPE